MAEPPEPPEPPESAEPSAAEPASPAAGSPSAEASAIGVDDPPAPKGSASGPPAAEPLEPLDPRAGERVERGAALCFLVSMLAALGLAVTYWQGGNTQVEGVLLAVVTGGIGVGIILWAKHFMPGEEVAEDREDLASTEAEVAAFTADLEAGGSSLRSRRLLLASATGALAAFGGALLFPIRSLGPRAGRGLKGTAFADGVRLVREDGEPLKPSDLAPGGVVTVWPDGHVGAADAPTLLIRTHRDQPFRPRPGRERWTVHGIVAYSKLCTHVGCPVGLYQAEKGLLLCPCHQSTFDVLDGARPVFGPAARSLPQLPLGLDDDGYIVATADFSDPVGPGFWDRGR
ncbi:MAG TPA: Rieske 2Fe-2S domain-containing protein [Acidimicrobiales bacterium]